MKTQLAQVDPAAAALAELEERKSSISSASTSDILGQSPEKQQSAFEALFQIIASAPHNIVEKTILEVRQGKSVEEVVASNAEETWMPTTLRQDQSSRASKVDARDQTAYAGALADTQQSTLRPLPTNTLQRRHSFQPTARLMANPNPRRILFEPYVERFIAAFEAREGVKSGGQNGLRAASELRAFSPLLDNAFHAVSLTAFGSSSSGRDFRPIGHRLYLLVLKQLQKAIADPKDSKSIEVLFSVLLITILEVCYVHFLLTT
jgi:hypothetical protein